MKAFLTLLVLAVISAGVFALGSLRKSGSDKPVLHIADEVALTVNTAKPEKGEIIRLVQAPGDVEPVLEVEIRSEIMAKIEEMPVAEGDLVRKGDLLCRLDDKNLLADMESAEARIAQLKAAIVQSQTDLEKAERDLNRQVHLSEADATSDLELRDYKTVRDKSRAIREMREHELREAEAMLKRIRENLEKTVIRSPIDGIVSKPAGSLRVAQKGEVVVTGTMNNPGTVIMTIVDLSKMQVRARVDEVDIPLVKPDQKARVYLQTDQNAPVAARVVRVASKGTKQTGRDVVTFETLLEVVSDDERVKPGMTANIEIEVARREDAITVPVEAVVHRMRKDLPEEVVAAFDRRQADVDLSARAKQAQYIKVVYVMDKDAAKVRVVESGIADTRRVELVEGVGLDDTVIIGPYRSLDQLKDGKKVKLADADKKEKKEGASKESKDERQASKDASAADQGADAKSKEGGADAKDRKDADSRKDEKTAAARNSP